MLSLTTKRPIRRGVIIAGLVGLLMLTVIGYTYAAFRIQRPIADTGGKINQYYLYAETDGLNTHKGIDFPYVNGTNVYAVTEGTVMQLREDLPDEDKSTDWGNFVLIRHTPQHYDRINGQMSYVYSMYLHLKQWSVPVAQSNAVSAGQKIGEVDNTGSLSQGNHLHLQIVVHPQSDRTLEPNTLDANNRSRNPELWLAPFNYSGTETAAVIGKVTDINGNPVGGLRIEGIQKPTNATWGTYGWSETYNYSWANPDDIFAENFGTTDIGPGTYHVEAKYTNGTLYRDLGTHTFVTGQVTYIGLHPIYQPGLTVHDASYTTASTAVRNNSDTHTANVNTTFFWSSGAVPQQETNMIAPRGSARLIPSATAFWSSAMVVSSEDVSTVVEQAYTKQVAAYSGPLPPVKAMLAGKSPARMLTCPTSTTTPPGSTSPR